MKCEHCKKEFSSFEWYRNGLELWKPINMILCDECLTEILEMKISIMKDEIKLIEENVVRIKNKNRY